MGMESVERGLEPQLQDAREKLEKLGFECEVFRRGGNLAPWLKVKTENQEVYVAYQYNKIVSTGRLPRVRTETAGFGEFEYYLVLPEASA